MLFDKQTYINRRNELKQKVGSGIIVLFGNTNAPANYPNNAYMFRQDSSFLYYFGQNQENLIGIIDVDNNKEYLLGAPDTTHIALEKLQDFWESKVPYPVIALFPQDDIAGLEASCDVIIEKSQKVEISGSIVPEEVASQLIKEAPDVLLNTIDYILTLNGALQKNLDLFVHVKQMLKGKTVEMYVDPETGIKSINHFLLK